MTNIPPSVTYAMVPETMAFDADLSDAAVRVYVVLLRHGDRPDQCYPSHQRIAELTGKSERSIGRIVKELEERGWIKRVQRGWNQSCAYYVFPSPNAPPSAPTTAHQSPLPAPPSAPTTAHQIAGNESHLNESKTPPPISPPLELTAQPSTDAPSSLTADFFNQFWQTYPRREAKGAARKAWDKAVTKALPEVVIAGAARYRDDPNREKAFTAHPSTWLNQERWTDEPLPTRNRRPQPVNRDPRRGRHDTTLEESFAAALGVVSHG